MEAEHREENGEDDDDENRGKGLPDDRRTTRGSGADGKCAVFARGPRAKAELRQSEIVRVRVQSCDSVRGIAVVAAPAVPEPGDCCVAAGVDLIVVCGGAGEGGKKGGSWEYSF